MANPAVGELPPEVVDGLVLADKADALIQELHLHPADTVRLGRLGALCTRLERWEEARRAFSRLLALDPGNHEARVALAGLAGKRREIETSPIAYGLGKTRQFSVHHCFTQGRVPLGALMEVLGDALLEEDGLALYGPGAFLDQLLAYTPDLAANLVAVLSDDPHADPPVAGVPLLGPGQVTEQVKTVFLCAIPMFDRQAMFERLPAGLRVLDAGLLADGPLAGQLEFAWLPIAPHTYPLHIPDLDIRSGLDVLIVDCPARTLAMMPNGVGYVDLALRSSGLKHQVVDLDVLLYHRFHIRRLFDHAGKVPGGDGSVLPLDPWQAEHGTLWNEAVMLPLFEQDIREAVDKIIAAAPKVIGFSVHGCNMAFTTHLVAKIRARLPDVVVIAGGFSCQNESIGMRSFPQADYICIGEADLTVTPLCVALSKGERPVGMPGVMSRFDPPGQRFIPAPKVHDLDSLDFPRYDWYPSLDIYRNYTGYQLTPIMASRGCRWSRCSFCAERFYWRIRSAKHFVRELEWLTLQGCDLFMFNESDLNGMPDRLLEICDEVIRQGLQIRLTGQLRIHKDSDAAFFRKLKAAGFISLRFGVDAFTERTLKLQAKGYTMKTVEQNIRDCHAAGINVSLNWVVGIPGETDEDIDEGVEFLRRVKGCVAKIDNINQLLLTNGSVYWLFPEKYGIKFSEEKEALYEKYFSILPDDAWWSEDPYLDVHGRQRRFERAVLGLVKAGVPVGPFAAKVIESILHKSINDVAVISEAGECPISM